MPGLQYFLSLFHVVRSSKFLIPSNTFMEKRPLQRRREILCRQLGWGTFIHVVLLLTYQLAYISATRLIPRFIPNEYQWDFLHSCLSNAANWACLISLVTIQFVALTYMFDVMDNPAIPLWLQICSGGMWLIFCFPFFFVGMPYMGSPYPAPYADIPSYLFCVGISLFGTVSMRKLYYWLKSKP